MGKKNNNKQQDIKKTKPKFKEMFNQLQTHEERHVSRRNKIIQKQSIQQEHSQRSEDGQEQDIDCPLQKLCENVSKLIAKNKITVKNAFQVPIIDLEKMVQFQNTNDNDYAWKKLSSTLENDYKIYGYRVDATHTDAFRILNNMARHEENPQKDLQEKQEEKQKEKQELLFNTQPKVNSDAEGKHLEKNIKNINIDKIQYTCDLNPILERTKRRFDQNGLKGLLINSVSINEQLELAINSEKIQKRLSGRILNQKINNIQSIKGNITSFKIMNEIITAKISNKISDIAELKDFQDLWFKIDKGSYSDRQDIIKLQPNNGDYMIQENDIYQQHSEMQDENRREIEEAMRLKPKKLLTNADIRAQQDLWMTDDIRKLLGNITTSKTLASKVQNQENMIQFDLQAQQRQIILIKQADKNQHNEQIQDKFLLPLKYVSKFKIQQKLSLRHEEQILNPEIPAYQVIQIAQRQLIDVRRQQISIRQTKEQLKNILANNQSSCFKDLFKQHKKVDKDVSPALCFLTLLHLANQNNLAFHQESEDNFFIK